MTVFTSVSYTHLEKAKGYDLETEVIYKDYPCPVVNYEGDAFKKVEQAINAVSYTHLASAPRQRRLIMGGCSNSSAEG